MIYEYADKYWITKGAKQEIELVEGDKIIGFESRKAGGDYAYHFDFEFIIDNALN